MGFSDKFDMYRIIYLLSNIDRKYTEEPDVVRNLFICEEGIDFRVKIHGTRKDVASLRVSQNPEPRPTQHHPG